MNDFTPDQITSLYLALAFIVALIGLWHNTAEIMATERLTALEKRRALLSKAYGKHVAISDPRVHCTARPTRYPTAQAVANPPRRKPWPTA